MLQCAMSFESSKEPAPGRSCPTRRWSAATILAALGLAYWLLAPVVVNGDGLGYLRQIEGRGLAPGHLAYLPLVRVVAGGVGYRVLFDLEPYLRGLSLLFALGALALFYDAVRLRHGSRPALFALTFLGLSHGFFRSAQEIEVYAAAAFFAVATLWALLRLSCAAPDRVGRWSVTAGLLGGLGVLFHLTLVLLGPTVFFLAGTFAPPGRRGRAVTLCAVAFTLALGGPLLLALHHEGIADAVHAWRWLRSSDHGVPYPHSWQTPLATLWGITRSLVYAPHPHEASRVAVVGLSLVGVGAWLVPVLLRWRVRPRPPRGDGVLLLVWAGPLTVFGALFYPSDTERWIFVLPVLALALAPASGRVFAAVLLVVAVVNAAAVEIPQACRDAPVRRAAAVDRRLLPSDLLVSPGHGWEELVGFSTPVSAQRFHLVYFVGEERDVDRAVHRLHSEIQRAFRRGGRVYAARLRDDEDPRGFKELAWFGISPAQFAQLFERYRPRPTELLGLWQLTDPDAPRPSSPRPVSP
jgi:hypothetical protein